MDTVCISDGKDVSVIPYDIVDIIVGRLDRVDLTDRVDDREGNIGASIRSLGIERPKFNNK